LTAAFDGNEAYAPAKVSTPFEVQQANSQISITPATQQVFYSLIPQYTVTLTSDGLPLAGKYVAITLDAANGARLSTSVVSTDYAGQFRWQAPVLPVGAYMLTAWFGLKVSADLDLSTPYYTGSSATASLSVTPFSFSGFFSPVDNPPVYNKAKAGSAVPVKFRLGGDFGLNIFASGYPLVKSVSCSAKAAIGPVEQVTATANNLNYDPLTGQYNYVWKTDNKWATSCRSLVLKFIDGAEKTALFQFTK
jgi:hypothetical protein